MKKEAPRVPIAEREPLNESTCLILEQVMQLLFTAVTTPKQFRALYRSLYKNDENHDGGALFDDMRLIRTEIQKSKAFRVQLEQWRRGGIVYEMKGGNEREMFEKFRSSSGYETVEQKMDNKPPARQRTKVDRWIMRRYLMCMDFGHIPIESEMPDEDSGIPEGG